MHLHLDIDTLILHNLPYEQRYPIRMAVEEELLQLFTDYGSPPELAQGAYFPQVTIPPLSITAATRPEVIGAMIARQVYQVLHQPSSSSHQHVSAPASGVGRAKPGLASE